MGDRAVGEADRAAIVATATDYIAGWLEGDPQRMRRCLHPELVKRSVAHDPGAGEEALEAITAEEMVQATAEGRGRRYARGFEVTILEVYGGMASVSVHSAPYVDLLHLARLGDRWLIVDVLWQRRPGDGTQG
jgi:hypothetical protein